MAWFWTDELARRLIAAGYSERALAELVSRPAAVAAADEESALGVARKLAGVEPHEASDTDAA
ncbi:MAG TPA: hypothetical protein VMS74_04960 [Acidimicrobiia bacterium]|nr:hypothetical protein [Acidimicrobiia bacterium]